MITTAPRSRPTYTMKEPSAPSRYMRFATLSLILTAAICTAYLGWVFLSRRLDRQRAEEEMQAKDAETNRKLTSVLGDGTVKILSFYASPAVVSRGHKSLLCYGVSNAASVRLQPPVEQITPSLSRCVEVNPTSSTEYKLVAEGKDGTSVEQSVQLRVSNER